MHETMKAVNTPWASLYFVAIIIIGNFMLLQLFLAILLDSFNVQSEGADEPLEGENNGGQAELASFKIAADNCQGQRPGKLDDAGLGKHGLLRSGEGLRSSGHSVQPFVKRSAGSIVEQRLHSRVNGKDVSPSRHSFIRDQGMGRVVISKDVNPSELGTARGRASGRSIGGEERGSSDPRYVRYSSEQMLVELLTGQARGQGMYATDVGGAKSLGNYGAPNIMIDDNVLSRNRGLQLEDDRDAEGVASFQLGSAVPSRPSLSASPRPAAAAVAVTSAAEEDTAVSSAAVSQVPFAAAGVGGGSWDGQRVLDSEPESKGLADLSTRNSSSRAILMRRASSKQRIHPEQAPALSESLELKDRTPLLKVGTRGMGGNKTRNLALCFTKGRLQ